MPYDLFWEPGGVVRRYFGDVTIAERERSFDAICQSPRFDQLTWSITDYLAVTTYEITPQATEEIAARHIAPLATNPNILIAAVVTAPHIVAAIEHFIALGFVEQPYRIFATEAEARAWIASQSPSMRRPWRQHIG
jgi:hypothetical protein